MLPWAATASSSAAAALLHASPRPTSHRAALPSYRPTPFLPPPLSIGFRAPARALPRGGDAFWEEPDDGSGSDYEDDGKQATVQRSSPFPSPFPLSRLVATRQQEREEQELRRGIDCVSEPNLLLQPFFTCFCSSSLHPEKVCAVYVSNFSFQYFALLYFELYTLLCRCSVYLEIELLLTPEEEAILDQNETADVTKVSSVKCVSLSYSPFCKCLPLCWRVVLYQVYCCLGL